MNNMMTLHPFSDADRGAVQQFEARVEATDEGGLWVQYIVDIAAEDIFLPDITAPERTDELWKTTCFELFVRRAGKSGYIEFNFSPSSRWAAYHFADYRKGVSDLPLERVPEIYVDFGETWFSVETSVSLPPDWVGVPLEANLTAVIESSDGKLGYWAVKHADEKPDFHHPDCFVLSLAAPARP